MKYRIRRFKSGGGKSASKHRTIDELINIFLEFCNKYEYHSIGLWRNRNTIGHEYNDEIRKDVFLLSDALNEYNASVDDSNKYLINSYMDESLELTPISFQTLFVDNHNNETAVIWSDDEETPEEVVADRREAAAAAAAAPPRLLFNYCRYGFRFKCCRCR